MTGSARRFVSYSANLEDVLLHRIFGDMPNGVFVDVGAADPRMENDCKALYDQGWSGINIEPNPSLLRALVEQRPRDRSFGCALAAEPGEQSYFEVEGTGLSTLDPVEAQRCRDNGWTVTERVVAVRTLASILEETGTDRVDFLKVDVEGWEEQVLRGNDWSRIRPGVIMVEATLPERPQRRQTGIEAFLSGHGYRLAHFDGLNDFFLRDDAGIAAETLRRPPSVFDNYVSYRIEELETHARQLSEEVAQAKRYSEAEHEARLRKQADLEDAQAILFDEQETSRAFRIASSEQLDLAAHRLLDSQTDCRQLRSALLAEQERGTAYADALAKMHRDREELLILRGQVNGQWHAMAELERRLIEAEAIAERRRLAEDEAASWIRAIKRSTSWRLTLPVRVGGRTLARLPRRISGRLSGDAGRSS